MIAKRICMLLINYTDIFATFLFLFIMMKAGDATDKHIYNGLHFFAGNISSPVWVLTTTSTLLIMIMPFHFGITTKSTHHENH